MNPPAAVRVPSSTLQLIKSLLPREEDELSFLAANRESPMAGPLPSQKSQPEPVSSVTRQLTPLQELFEQEENNDEQIDQHNLNLTPLQAVFQWEEQNQATIAIASVPRPEQSRTVGSDTERLLASMQRQGQEKSKTVIQTLLSQKSLAMGTAWHHKSLPLWAIRSTYHIRRAPSTLNSKYEVLLRHQWIIRSSRRHPGWKFVRQWATPQADLRRPPTKTGRSPFAMRLPNLCPISQDRSKNRRLPQCSE